MSIEDSRNHKHQIIAELSRRLGRFTNMEAALTAIVDTACSLTGSEMASLLLYEQETDLMKFIAGPVNQNEKLRRLRVPVERSLAGSVFKNAQPAIVQNAQTDSRIFHDVEQQVGVITKNIAAAPIYYQGEPIGVIEAMNKSSDPFNENDLAILDALGSQASVMIISNLLMDEVQRAFDEVDHLEKMKSDFIAITSHELRTPLGLIIGHATFLSEMIDDVQLKEQMEVILRSANRLKTIIEDITKFNDIQSGSTRLRYKLISINQVIQKVVASSYGLARDKNITLKTRIPSQDLVVDADEEKISIALGNLVNNAITYTDAGGQILVALDRLPGYVQVTVLDTGIGIPAKDLPHVFERFFQVQSHLTRRHGGMGLGLSVAKAMIELHKGQIWVESIEGKGSKFYFVLPAQGTKPNQGKPVFQS